MDIFTSALLFFIVALVVYLFITRQKHSKPLPPGPRGWELVRAFPSTVNGKLVLEAEKWACKYGEVVFLPLPQGNLVFLNSPSVAKELFAGKATEKFTNNRMWSYVGEKVCLWKCVAFSNYSDPSWTKMRKLLHSNLKFYGDGVAKFEETVGKAVDQFVTTLDSYCGQDIQFKDLVEDSLVGIISVLLTGQAPDKARIQTMKRLSLCALQVDDPGFSFALKVCPLLEYIPGTYYSMVRCEIQQSKAEIVKCFFEDIKKTRIPGSSRGVVDNLLEYQSNGGADWMTDDHVIGMILDIVVAGSATTTHTMNAIVFYLLHHQDVTHKIQEEVDRVIGHDRKPTLGDRHSCSYTEAFILESMRVLSLAPLGLDHLVIQDVELKGFHIPKGTVAFNNTFVYHKSPDLWIDPESFKPERFLDHEGQLLPANHPNRQSMLAFGTGKRSCPGETFARARIFLYVTTLLQHFDILPPLKEKLLPMEKDSWNFEFVTSVKPYHCCLRRRQH